ncbi:MAG: hypothetical protein ABI703_08650 [Gemmatimonadales bacterium]
MRLPRSAATLLILTASCGAGWHTTPVAPGSLPARQQAQVWTDGTALRWHALEITGDSISGVPFTRPPGCDSCRVAVSREAVDSVRLGSPTTGFLRAVGLGVGITLVAVVVICRADRCQLGD